MKDVEIFVPGRLCLFGEHSDWAGRYTLNNPDVLAGKAIVTGINLGIYANARTHDKFSIISIDESGNTVSFSCEMKLDVLKMHAKQSHFFCYACGVAAYMLEHYKIGGVSIKIDKVTLPIKKGLSSSAAICVLTARAFNELYHLHMSVNGEMNAAYRGELLTNSRCGRLDQACAYGIQPVCLEFSGDEISTEILKVGKDLFWVFADLKSKKNTKKILSDLNRSYPFPQTEQDIKVHEALGKDNHEIISKVIKALEIGDAQEIGLLMTESQRIFDEKIAPNCSSELTAPKLHSVLNDDTIKKYSYGGKGVGSQGDGTIQFIAKDLESQHKLIDYLNDKLGLNAYAFTLPSSSKVSKAIIPVAGFGTRMYPETRFVKKEFLPVVDSNGFAKPVIMYLLEEIEASGIEEIILIVGKDEIEQFQEIFKPLSEEHLSKLPQRVQDYEKLIARISSKIKYAVQEERRGFGHAVYQAKKFIGNEPALLMLGDFIYKSNLNISCTKQTLNAYRKSGGKLIVSIRETPIDDVVHYGVLFGKFDTYRKYLMNVTEMVEKPSVEYAVDNLGVKTVGNNAKYYSTFGQYVLTPDVFDYLEEDIKEHDNKKDDSEIQLTSALVKALNNKGMVGVLVDGTSYDVGIPKAYKKTISEYGK